MQIVIVLCVFKIDIVLCVSNIVIEKCVFNIDSFYDYVSLFPDLLSLWEG